MVISRVEKDTVGASLGFKSGDRILSFNGFPAEDILDYVYYDARASFTVTAEAQDGTVREIRVKKKSYEPLGLEFRDDGMVLKTCRNRCVFCFVDQLPRDPSLRETLRVKDDDYRHSFLYGTYVTATNFSERDIARIKRLKLSPLYISVHSTDEALRLKLLGIKQSLPVLPLIKELSKAGIRLHTQIVYCPGINEDTEQTARALFPYCESLAVVPVGLTDYKNPSLSAVSKSDAERLIGLTERLQAGFLKEKGKRFIWAADEFYHKAGIKLPNPETYEGYPQIENGVGLLAKFQEDFDYALDALENAASTYKSVSVATGISAYPFIKEKAQTVSERYGVEVLVYPVENRFFGASVTVAGLLTGGNILRELNNKPLGEKLLLPSVMFREGGEEFLDNMTQSELSAQLGVPVEKVSSDGESFVYALLGTEEEIPQGGAV